MSHEYNYQIILNTPDISLKPGRANSPITVREETSPKEVGSVETWPL